MLYAVVDIETTGGYASGNGITEIAVLVHDGISILERYETLLNPGQEIPVYIQALTGITDEMVADAPRFEDVAGRLYELLQDKVFVAHNVNFDYSFVRHQLGSCGYELQSKKLCTVRMSRKLLPGHASYSLGKLCNTLGISISNRHRAGGDAEATAVLLAMLVAADTEGLIGKILGRGAKEQNLPPNLPRTEVDKLPLCPGVYYFKDSKGKVIYVGKAKSLRKRVSSHFTGNNTGRQRQNFLKDIYSIDFEVCATELMAFILEAAEIKRLWPDNNRAMKRFEHKYGLYVFEDQKGYLRLGIDKYKRFVPALYSFNTLLDGHNLLRMLASAHVLCEKLCSIQRGRLACTAHAEGGCAGACIGKESAAAYNVRVKYAMADLKAMLPSFALIDEGRHGEERSCLLVEEGRFYGMGYIAGSVSAPEPGMPAADLPGTAEALKPLLKPLPSNDYIVNLVLSHAERFPHKKLLL
ncbi:exonuclease domain-containing protein [Pedobacter sp. JY14-1]|uniref:exonuclease domain-containing protein n=1 Tax=Pedobacter sp. JY14-1 TaxID=3034151 RepID=UPI0023E098A3|nr:exonuclease domain-containing protein [Pedobacter sp. JY14-1]